MASTRLKKAGGAATLLAALTVAVVGAYEGLRLYSYKDPVGIWTACYGETLNIKPGMKFTKEQCDEMFVDSGLARHERALRRCLHDPDLVPVKTYVAMLSLAYNIGEGGFCRSSVVRRWNAGDRYGACDAFLAWNKAGGRVLQGLVTRRKDERKWCVDGLDEPVTVNYENDIPPGDRDVLRQGDRGFWVEQLQQLLDLPVDGRFGPETLAAVVIYQAAHGLPADGVVGAATWAALLGEDVPAPEPKPAPTEPVPAPTEGEVAEAPPPPATAPLPAPEVAQPGEGEVIADERIKSPWLVFILMLAGAAIVVVVIRHFNREED